MRRKVKLKVRIEFVRHLTATGNHMHGITQCYLLPGSDDFPAFTEAGTQFSDPGDARLS